MFTYRPFNPRQPIQQGQRVRRHAQYRAYYKRSCLRCEQVVEIYECLQPTRRPFPRRDLAACPLCENTRIKTETIDLREYQRIQKQWDLLDQGELGDDDFHVAGDSVSLEGNVPVLDLSEFLE